MHLPILSQTFPCAGLPHYNLAWGLSWLRLGNEGCGYVKFQAFTKDTLLHPDFLNSSKQKAGLACSQGDWIHCHWKCAINPSGSLHKLKKLVQNSMVFLCRSTQVWWSKETMKLHLQHACDILQVVCFFYSTFRNDIFCHIFWLLAVLLSRSVSHLLSTAIYLFFKKMIFNYFNM